MGIKIYGASDDLIEIKGDIEEEYNVHVFDDDDGRYLAFSDGTVARVYFDQEGIWRIHVVARGKATQSHTLPIGEDDYTEVLELTDAPIMWVVMGTHFRTPKGTKEKSTE